MGSQVRRRLAKPMVFGPRGFKSHPRRISLNPLHSQAKGDIISYGLWMQKQGYRKSTIHYRIQALKSIARRSNLLDPESVKAFLASASFSEARKAKLVELKKQVFQRRGLRFIGIDAKARIHRYDSDGRRLL